MPMYVTPALLLFPSYYLSLSLYVVQKLLSILLISIKKCVLQLPTILVCICECVCVSV